MSNLSLWFAVIGMLFFLIVVTLDLVGVVEDTEITVYGICSATFMLTASLVYEIVL